MAKYKKILTVIIISIFACFYLPIFSCFLAHSLAVNDAETDNQKTVAILTSGGDAPGMNAAVRSFTKTALNAGMKVIGIKYGYEGLLNSNFVYLSHEDVSGINREGGTILHSSRSTEFNTPEGVEKAAKICKDWKISGLVVVGGDGSFRGAKDLTEYGIPCIVIPATIDNDMKCSDYTIGFDTAINTVVQLIDKIRDTSKSHDRCFVVEVMGRACGDIALHTGIASEAVAVLVPEVDYDFQNDVLEKIKLAQEKGETHFIIVVAEGVDGVDKIAKQIEEQTKIDTRYIVLGHVQRGGAPTGKDREVASKMGIRAAKLLLKNKGNRAVVVRDGKIIDIDITEALTSKKKFDEKLYKYALELGQ